ncbi:hypothetical protein O181_098436 [Austropuccinia psidii MF-1]|uniref:Tf2-1-like SH3-like domain-containing protein n=1 Tax=Austropuccinia psidii MF-1 TaxID=1389203 RepID=A0A9Q3JBD6_9BASI|nr:hypothetical protein [Austropuccinia psidii MF-1]
MTIIYKKGKILTNEHGLGRWPLDNVKSNPAYDPDVAAKIPIHYMEIDRKKYFRFSEWAPERGTPGTVQRAYNTIHNSTTGNASALVEKGWNPLLPVDHLKTNLPTIKPTAKNFHEMWKRACDTAAKSIAEANEYNKQRWDKSNMEPDFKEGDQVLVSTLNCNILKGPKKMRDSFVGPFIIIKLIGINAVEVIFTEEFSRKHQVFPVSLFKPYFQKEEYKFPFRKKNPTPPEIVEVEESPGTVQKIMQARKIRINGKDQRQYLVRFKSQTADKDKWLA